MDILQTPHKVRKKLPRAGVSRSFDTPALGEFRLQLAVVRQFSPGAVHVALDSSPGGQLNIWQAAITLLAVDGFGKIVAWTRVTAVPLATRTHSARVCVGVLIRLLASVGLRLPWLEGWEEGNALDGVVVPKLILTSDGGSDMLALSRSKSARSRISESGFVMVPSQ